MSSGDLKHLLQDLATEGSTTVELDEQRLVPRIEARRRRRAGLVAAVSASTAVVLAAGAFVVLPGGGREKPVATQTPTQTLPRVPVPARTITIAPWKTPNWMTPFRCGATLTAPITGDSGLRLTTTTQAATRSADGRVASFDMQLTNTTGKMLDFIATPGGPGIVVVKDGVVVALPLAQNTLGHRWTFAPGQTVTVQTVMSVQRCDTTDPGALEPGTYQIYAWKTFNQNRRDYALFHVQAAGGPWTIQVV